MTQRKFCVIDCETSNAWKPITFCDMFRSKLGEEGEVWECVEVARGAALPNDLSKYHGIIISGSHFNCRDRAELVRCWCFFFLINH